MIGNLGDQLRCLSVTTLSEYLHEHFDVTHTEANKVVAKLTLSQHRQMTQFVNEGNTSVISQMTKLTLREATTQGTQGTVNQMNTPATPTSAEGNLGDDDSDMAAALAGMEQEFDIDNLQPDQEIEYTDAEGNVVPATVIARRGADNYTVDTGAGTQDLSKDVIKQAKKKYAAGVADKANKAVGAVKSGMSRFASNYNKGFAEEISRIQELAGIETSGGSIIGDTSDSHKPSTKLRKKQRMKSEKSGGGDTVYAAFKKGK